MTPRRITAETIIALAKALHPDAYVSPYDRGVLIDDGFTGLVFYRVLDCWRTIRIGRYRNAPVFDIGEIHAAINELANAYAEKTEAQQRTATRRLAALQEVSATGAYFLISRRSGVASGAISA